MKIISISKDANLNYLCKIIKVPTLRKHPNADKLLVMTVDGNDIITSNDTKEGQVSIYFPLECQIATEYLSAGNEYRKNIPLNADPNSPGGFFEEHGRVKAVKLRGNKSEGYVVPISSLECVIGDKYTQLEKYIGEEFDTVDGLLLAKKYQVKIVKQQGSGNGKEGKPARKFARLIDNQFRLHYDTSQLGKNLHKIKPDSLISVTWKLHGTSFVSSRILCNRKLRWWERIAKALGVRVVEAEYANVYSSRRVVKDGEINRHAQSYYKYDIYGEINNFFKDQLLDGESVYGEAVGYTKDGGFIQKGYDYGCKEKKHELYVYRITHTSTQGKVIDLPFELVKQRCEQLGVKHVPEIYMGRADQFVLELTAMDWLWHDGQGRSVGEALFQAFKDQFVYDQDCDFCKNKVPSEGIVLRVEGLKPEAFKLKNFRFLERETKELDQGLVNLEDSQEA